MKTLCTKHAEADKDWCGGDLGWGPQNPLPHGLSMKQVDRQRAMIRSWCEDGRGCEPSAPALRLVK